MKLSTTLSHNLLEHLTGKSQSLNVGAYQNCWLALYVSCSQSDAGAVEFIPSNDTSTGIYGKEVGSDNNYARINIYSLMNRNYMSYKKRETTDTPHDYQIGNKTDINFNAAIDPSNPESQSSAYDWGTIIGVGLFTQSTGGSPYAIGLLNDYDTNPPQVTVHTSFHFYRGRFEIFLNETGEPELSAAGSAS